MQRILSHMRKAIEEYNMIEEGDKIAVCLSGGKEICQGKNGAVQKSQCHCRRCQHPGDPGPGGTDQQNTAHGLSGECRYQRV